MRILPLLALALCPALPLPVAKTLHSYSVDVEGGQATLLVTHYHTDARGGSLAVEYSRNGFRKVYN